MLNPLWLPENNTIHSSYFEVEAGKAVSLFAVGLEQFKMRQDFKEALDEQRICISRVLRDVSTDTVKVKGPAMNMCDCGFVYTSMTSTDNGMVEEMVSVNGCPWQLTQCNNFRILIIPGTYRLHLNDDTAIGKAQVYAEQFAIQNMPQNAAGLFFG